MPYSVGLLQAHTIRHSQDTSRYSFLPFVFEPEPIKTILPQIQLAEVLGFSIYVWNEQRSLALAHLFKQDNPDSLIIFGGPQVPDRAEDWLRQHPWVDLVCHGPGEETFLQLLEALPENNWQVLTGISWIDSNGDFQHIPQPPRQNNLDRIPSPYLQGVFNSLLKQYPNYRWNVLWETNRGCPFSCTFCDWGSATQSKVFRFEIERLQQEISWFSKHKIDMVYCCDANYGILKRDLEITESFIEASQRHSYPRGFYIQNAKNVTERSYLIQKKITQAGLNPDVTLSLQSIDPTVLKSIRRDNISLDTFRTLQQRFRADNVHTYTDYLVGLPGETRNSFLNGVSQVIEEGQHHLIKFYNVYVLPNAELNQPAYRKEYGIQTIRQPYFEHGVVSVPDVQEYQEMVIATASLSLAEWREIRCFAWWVELLYLHHKLLQLPIMLIQALTPLSYRNIFEHYLCGEIGPLPLIQNMRDFMANKSLQLQQGDPEFCPLQKGSETLWLTAENYLITGLSQSGAIAEFFDESRYLLDQLLLQHQHSLPAGLLDETFQLAYTFFNSYVQQQTFEMQVSFNIWEIYQQVLHQQEIVLKKQKATYIRDWTTAPFHEIRIKS